MIWQPMMGTHWDSPHRFQHREYCRSCCWHGMETLKDIRWALRCAAEWETFGLRCYCSEL